MGTFPLKRPRIISKKFPRVDSHIDGVTKSLEGLVFAYSKQVDRAIQKKHLMMLLSSLALAIVLGSLIAPKGKADSAIFNPKSCLGGWVNVKYAEGKPETTSNTDEESFSIENSAILPAGTNADIYCGDFTGEPQVGTRPTKMLVTLSWTKGPDVELDKIITGQSFASSSADILDTSSTTNVIFTLATSTDGSSTTSSAPVETNEMNASDSPSIIDKVIDAVHNFLSPSPDTAQQPAPTGDQVVPAQTQPADQTPTQTAPTDQTQPAQPSTDAAPAPASTGDAAPTSFIDTLAHRVALAIARPVYAEESTTTVEPLHEDSTSSVIVPVDVPTQPVITSSIDGTSTASSTISDATSTDIGVATDTASTTVVVDPESDDEATNNFLQVLYSFDGVTWINLGKVNEISMKYRTFEIPVTATTSWYSLSKLQIKVTPLTRYDPSPTVYLDAMQVDVLYEQDVPHTHPDFARDVVLKDKTEDNIRVISIVNSDTGTTQTWYTTINEQGSYGVPPDVWALVDLDQPGIAYHFVDLYGGNIFFIDDDSKKLWVKNILRGSSDSVDIIPAVGTSTPTASTTVSFIKPTGEEWVFEYNDRSKKGLQKLKKE
jgi:hypothetical protein